MRSCSSRIPVVAAALAGFAASASAQLFDTGDTILAVDSDESVNSWYPDAESPFWVPDQDSTTKYLNFGKTGTGTIIQPFAYGPAVIRSMRLTTANDAPERDPASWELYGTNDPITSDDNSEGNQEDWTLIASGDANLPDDREAFGPEYSFSNETSYSAFKIIFPTVKDVNTANSMQVADISLFTGTDGGGDQILELFDDAIAVGELRSESSYPGLEGPRQLFDGDANTKYLNFGRENSGFIVARADGQPVVVEQFTITTANDFPERDPTSWELYGTDDPITSEDNSTGMAESWVLIDSDFINLPDERFTAGPTVTVDNSTAYTGYKMVFPSVKDPSDWPGDSMQISEVLFEGTGGGCYADCNADGIVDTRDFICFLGLWSAGDMSADCNGDTVIDTRDFICFLGLWSDGC